MISTDRLSRYSLFGGLVPEQIERIIPLLERAEASQGAVLLAEGKPNDRIWFILQGRVSISRAGRLLVELGEGQAFGEMELLEVMPSAATVTALEPLVAATISNHAFRDIYHLDLAAFALIVMNLARDLSRRLRHMDELACESGGD